jgi:phenylpropionate dioxygenase-like ring-hydroxylating dioxygenase large terminal subunit
VNPAAPRALAPVDFVSAQAFARECRSVFPAGWVPVCRASDVAEPGAQRAAVIGDTPLLITRGRDGTLNALSNVCRHRAMTLVETAEQAGAIRCPYHLWTYDLEGRLLSAPLMGDVDIAGCDLPRYAVEDWGGWVLVNLDGKAPPLAERLAPLAPILRPDLIATWREGYRLRFVHDWNWKVMLENFAESYHHIGAHVQSLQSIWPAAESSARLSTPHWIDLTHSLDPERGALRVFVIFPMFLLAIVEAAPVEPALVEASIVKPFDGVVWYEMIPSGPERITLDIVGYFPKDRAADAQAMAEQKALALAIHQEDIPVCARTQAGLRSPDAAMGPLSPLEDGLAVFRSWVANAGH